MTIEMLILSATEYFGGGWILGFIEKWNLKVFYGIFAFLIVLLIVSTAIISTTLGSEAIVLDKWYITLYNIFWIFIGIQVGKFSYTELKK
jgi:uncharacterized membrane protein (Fun14 family)